MLDNIKRNELYFVEDWHGDVELLWVEECLDGCVFKCRKLRQNGMIFEPNKDDTPYLVCKDRFLINLKDWIYGTYSMQ